MPLPENIECLWNQATSEESFQALVTDLRAYSSEHWAEEQNDIENLLLRLLEFASAAGIRHVLAAIRRPRLGMNLKNEDLIEQIIRYLDDPSPEIRIEAIHAVGGLASEGDEAPGRYLTLLMTMLKTETDISCRNRLLVYANTSVSEAQRKLAYVCLGETADKKFGPWREMFVLCGLQKLDVKWHDWRAFLDKSIPEMEAWENLTWMAFRSLVEHVNPDSSLYRELIERISELMRIAEVVEYKLEFATNLSNRLALIKLMGPMSRQRKRKVLNQNMGFLVGAINYDDPSISWRCLELFLELSIVPLLSTEQRTHLLTHKDDHVRELAEELFEPSPYAKVEPSFE